MKHPHGKKTPAEIRKGIRIAFRKQAKKIKQLTETLTAFAEGTPCRGSCPSCKAAHITVSAGEMHLAIARELLKIKVTDDNW
jgi:hypothetical protein